MEARDTRWYIVQTIISYCLLFPWWNVAIGYPYSRHRAACKNHKTHVRLPPESYCPPLTQEEAIGARKGKVCIVNIIKSCLTSTIFDGERMKQLWTASNPLTPRLCYLQYDDVGQHAERGSMSDTLENVSANPPYKSVRRTTSNPLPDSCEAHNKVLSRVYPQRRIPDNITDNMRARCSNIQAITQTIRLQPPIPRKEAECPGGDKRDHEHDNPKSAATFAKRQRHVHAVETRD